MSETSAARDCVVDTRQFSTSRLRTSEWIERSHVLLALVLVTGLTNPPAALADEVRSNIFNDPFEQVTKALDSCPVPLGPAWTADEAAAAAHGRAQRGVSCYLAGRCRLSNAYLYDKEIAPRLKLAIESDGGYAQSSVWVWSQRRWVWLMGCVKSKQESQGLETLIRRIDDVEGVVNQLMVGTKAVPAYEVRPR